MSAPSRPALTIDHVELFVPDRRAAAEWYARVLGCEPIGGAEQWAAHPDGPLMISPDGGRTKLALFAGDPQGNRPTAGFHRVAFRASASQWLALTARLDQLLNDEGRPAPRIMDHGGAWSVYFSDPYGHHLEITTYETEAVRASRRA
jgi:catechol 2,3-dioxygenase-like lactoylglutathione lyase family enzyme